MIPPSEERSASGAPLARTVAVAASCLALACAGPRAGAGASATPPTDCEAIREETLSACGAGFALGSGQPGTSEDLELAADVVCAYAGAVAWSGCHRGAFRRFQSRSPDGACGDRADYVESSIETSCMRPIDVPLARWSSVVRGCFERAAASRELYVSSCRARPAG